MAAEPMPETGGEQTEKRVSYFDEQFAGEKRMTGWDELIEEKERIQRPARPENARSG